MANSEYLFKKAKIEAMSLASDAIKNNGFLLVDSTYISITDIINKSIILNKLDVFLSNDELVIIREKLLMSVLDYLDEFCRKIKFSEPNLGDIMIYYRKEDKVVDFLKTLDFSLFFQQLKQRHDHIFTKKHLDYLSERVEDLYDPSLILEFIPESIFYHKLILKFNQISKRELMKKQKGL